MTLPIWIANLVQAFWTEVGEAEPFPRSLRRAIASALPLTVVLLPKLTISAVLKWLEDAGVAWQLKNDDRPLRACLVARNGSGVAFIDGSDTDVEQRFSIAHELAHFLRDYWHLRRKISRRLGANVLDILDGNRQPTATERVHALLRDVPIGFQIHLMDRDREGNPATVEIARAENDADRLAYELLAPVAHVFANDTCWSRGSLDEKLREFYGLPDRHAGLYANLLLSAVPPDPLLLRLNNLA